MLAYIGNYKTNRND
jgi:hypothetical protein